MTTAAQRHAAQQVADDMRTVHDRAILARGVAKEAKLPRAARIDKLAAQAADLRDYYAQFAKKV